LQIKFLNFIEVTLRSFLLRQHKCQSVSIEDK